MEIEFYPSIANIPADDWDSLWPKDYPFTRHSYLSALEKSGCINQQTGWQPHHCVVRNGQQLLAAIPLYIKSHSHGEYVFDWSWANAYAEHGLNYYPKLLNAIPFTPCTGPRWGINPEIGAKQSAQLLHDVLAELILETNRIGCSSFHSLFVDHTLLCRLDTQSLVQRTDCQYHWFNQNHQNFADYLQTLTSRKRKTLNKEREKINAQNIRVVMTTGDQLSTEDWEGFYHLYRNTYLKLSGHEGYLNPNFFRAVGENLADNIVMAQAFHQDQWVAAALYFFDKQTLYGRYWGCLNEYDALHFECCYYQGVQFAINRGLNRFDPGAQGEHKVARGFQPIYTASLHYIAHPGFEQAIAQFVSQEAQYIGDRCEALRKHLPFKEGTQLTADTVLIRGE